jgi:hypothetical protein
MWGVTETILKMEGMVREREREMMRGLFDTKAGLSVLGCAEGKVASLSNSTQHCCLQ